MSNVESNTSIWVWAANVQEVNGQQGFVECPQSVANKLIAEGLAEDPTIGGFHLSELEDATATVPKKRPGRPPKAETVAAPVAPTPAPEPTPIPDPVPPVVEPTPVPEAKELTPEPAGTKKVYLTK